MLLLTHLMIPKFYFSDGNLRRDVFLREHVQANEGWAHIATIADFGKVLDSNVLFLLWNAKCERESDSHCNAFDSGDLGRVGQCRLLDR